MELLAHWDYAAQFTGYQAAALMLGLDPHHLEFDSEQSRVSVVLERLELHYSHALKRLYCEVLRTTVDGYELVAANRQFELKSTTMYELLADWQDGEENPDFSNWLLNDQVSSFNNQMFARKTIVAWLQANELTSVYEFQLDPVARTGQDGQPACNQKNEPLIDPSDRPEELDIANCAFQAVFKGYGDQGDTHRNRLLAYLRQYYPDLKNQAMERIATIANPDKSTGRKKSSQG